MTSFWSAIVNAAILSALLSLVVWLGLRITPRRALNAASRYAIWWIVLVVTLALPLGHVGVKVAIRQVASIPPRFTEVSRQLEWEVPVVESRPAVARGLALPVEIPASPWLRGVMFFWLAGSGLLLVRVFVSYAALYRRSKRAVDAPDLNALIAGGRRVRIAISNEIGIPLATGPFRPAILIPAQLFDQIGAADLDRIVSHEAAHLARRDDYALFIQRVTEALFALHPVVRWLTRQIDLEREIACDDIVVSTTDQARSYADCLTRMVALCGGVRPSLAATSVADSRSHLSRRIELLVDKRRTTQTQVLVGRFAVIVIALICAAEVLAKTPLLVAFASPQSAMPRTATPASAIAQHDAPSPAIQHAVTEDSDLLQYEYWLYSLAKRPSQLVARRPALLAQAAQTQPETQATPSETRPSLLYILAANDIVGVSVFDSKVIPGTYAIGPDGDLSLPLIGSVKASGLTIPELTALIAEKLRTDGIVSAPVVNVQLLRNNSKQYTLLGGVSRPGPHPLLRQTTILDALVDSGGFKALANPQKIALRRGAEVFHFNYNEVLKGIHMDQNIIIEDGDIIMVPE